MCLNPSQYFLFALLPSLVKRMSQSIGKVILKYIWKGKHTVTPSPEKKPPVQNLKYLTKSLCWVFPLLGISTPTKEIRFILPLPIKAATTLIQPFITTASSFLPVNALAKWTKNFIYRDRLILFNCIHGGETDHGGCGDCGGIVYINSIVGSIGIYPNSTYSVCRILPITSPCRVIGSREIACHP